MAISFDDDPLGSILEYGHLYKTGDREGRDTWERTNIRTKTPAMFSPWTGYGINEHHLVDMLIKNRDHLQVQSKIRQTLTYLTTKHLIERDSGDADQATQWSTITALGSDLVQSNAHLEYIHGLSYVVKRWRSSVFKIYPKNGTAQIGTGFLVREDLVATARHIPAQLGDFTIATENGDVLPHNETIVLPNAGIDVALIKLTQPINHILPMRLSEHVDILDDVVVMGYPPVARTDNAYLLANKGEITAVVTRYDENTAGLLISTLLRGGYSGGPVINVRGNVIGVMAENLYQQIGEDNIDRNAGLGIAAATPICFVRDLLINKGAPLET